MKASSDDPGAGLGSKASTFKRNSSQFGLQDIDLGARHQGNFR
jgi:hypothetical protein